MKHEPMMALNAATPQHSGPQAVARVRNSVKRPHAVPSTLTRQMRTEIGDAVAAGRSVAQVAKEYQCSAAVVIEIWGRRIVEQLERLRSELVGRRAA